MGTNCAPLFADLFLYSYEAEFVQGLLKSGKKQLAQSFSFTYRYIDDVLSLNNSKFSDYLDFIYPSELGIKDTTESTKSTPYFDCLLEIDNSGKLSTKLYDKRDDFNFPLVNVPFLCDNIPASPAYGVFVSQLIRYARACYLYHDFILRARQLPTRLLKTDTRVQHKKVLWTTLSDCRKLPRFSHTIYMWHFRNMLNGDFPAR